MKAISELKQLAEELATDAKAGKYETIIITAEDKTTKTQLTLSDFEEIKKMRSELVPNITVEYKVTN
jgi:rRNA maturation protein Rpf1